MTNKRLGRVVTGQPASDTEDCNILPIIQPWSLSCTQVFYYSSPVLTSLNPPNKNAAGRPARLGKKLQPNLAN